MNITLKNVEKEYEDLMLGDALVMTDGDLRILVRLVNGYGAYSPKKNIVHCSECKSIQEVVNSYRLNIERVIKRDNLELIER